MLNRAEIIGRLTHDPELGYTQQGTAYCQLRVATNRRVNGEQVADFHTVVTWNALAEQVANLRKGEVVYVDGRLETSTWEKAGERRQMVRIVASRVVFLGRGHQINSTTAPANAAPDEHEDDLAPEPTPAPRRARRSAAAREVQELAS